MQLAAQRHFRARRATQAALLHVLLEFQAQMRERIERNLHRNGGKAKHGEHLERAAQPSLPELHGNQRAVGVDGCRDHDGLRMRAEQLYRVSLVRFGSRNADDETLAGATGVVVLAHALQRWRWRHGRRLFLGGFASLPLAAAQASAAA